MAREQSGRVIKEFEIIKSIFQRMNDFFLCEGNYCKSSMSEKSREKMVVQACNLTHYYRKSFSMLKRNSSVSFVIEIKENG